MASDGAVYEAVPFLFSFVLALLQPFSASVKTKKNFIVYLCNVLN